MNARTKSDIQQQRDESVEKIEREVERKVNLGNALLQHQRLILQDLPFNGQPALLNDEHRQAIENLVEKSARYQITVKRIIGYASAIGDEQVNQDLSQQRAEEVHHHLLAAINIYGFTSDEIISPNLQILARGESQLPSPGMAEEDNPLNRRVEIVFILKYVFPTPPGSYTQTSTLWKIDFGPAGSGFFMQGGVGTLTMLPDGNNGLSAPISKPMKFEQIGVSMGLFSKLKKLKFIKKFPLIRRLLHDLHPERAGNFAKTQSLVQNMGFSVDIINEGGEFQTSTPLSFVDMQWFNYATLSAGISVLGKAEGAMLLLHSGHFFSYTMIFGLGQNIAVPDFEVQFVPAGFVQVTLD